MPLPKHEAETLTLKFSIQSSSCVGVYWIGEVN